jgi:trans-AT polyketide synthase, acyltransferase and oxidoreductase domains
MALVFRWYFGRSMRLALKGAEDRKVDFQVHCGPALGAFNRWIKGSELEAWRNRHVDDIALKIMKGAADLLNDRFSALSREG